MLNLVGGDCVEGINRLETVEGFCRLQGKAFIPAAKEALKGLCKVNKGMVGFVQNNRSEGTATLELDAWRRISLMRCGIIKAIGPTNL